MSRLTDTHIAAQQRLRDQAARAIGQAWNGLPGYDERDVSAFLTRAVPISVATQRASIGLTNAYLARQLRRQPAGVDTAAILAAIRPGVSPAELYRRPFVTVWTSLKNGADYRTAVAAGLARASSTAAMDVQLAFRATAQAVQQADPAIVGYRRVADPGACDYCAAIDGAFVKDADAMPLHNHCGCGLEPITRSVPVTPVPTDTVAVHEHGELGPVLAAPDDHFTRL